MFTNQEFLNLGMQSSTMESEVEDREATAQPLHKRIEGEIMMNTFKGDNMTAPT